MIRHTVSAVVMCLALIAAGSTQAGKPAEKLRGADALQQRVDDALRQELEGTDEARNGLLRRILQKQPDYQPARWQSGYLRVGDSWKKFDAALASPDRQRLLDEYRAVRKRAADTVTHQLRVADWCAEHGLVDEERAHLTRVLEKDANHVSARSRLGYRNIRGVWMSDAERTAAQLRAKQLLKDLKLWRPKIERFHKRLAASARDRRRARKSLLEIRNPAAVVALELSLSGTEGNSLLLVEVLGEIDAFESSIALARQAVFSPWTSARIEATDQLKKRPIEEFAPPLLALLSTPMTSDAEFYLNSRGRMTYAHTFYTEDQEVRKELRLQTEFDLRFIDIWRGQSAATMSLSALFSRNSNRLTLLRAANDKNRVGLESQTRFDDHNALLTERISNTLAKATGEKLPAEPNALWQWWNDHNEVFVRGEKPIRQFTYTQYMPIRVESPRQPIRFSPRTMSCLVAGTPVWTESGPMAIEKIEPGDRVLAQDIETGELSLKPVLKRTVRPAAPLVKIVMASETIRTTGGHPFWINGEGWTKSRLLKPGARFHSVTGTEQIRAISEQGSEPTYNLIVADFHTYFVGGAKILSHDNTARKPTNAVVPGLPRSK